MSFGALVDKGIPKEEIMRLKGLSDAQYEKTLANLLEIRKRPPSPSRYRR